MTSPNEPPSKFKVALIQMNPETLDPTHNFQTASSYIRQAAAAGADLAVLPEYHLTGWAPSSPLFASIAEEAEIWFGRYQGLARELGICIVPGTIVTAVGCGDDDEDESEIIAGGEGSSQGKKRLLNIATFISNDGSILGQYAKANLWHPEREYLTSGPHHALSLPSCGGPSCTSNTEASPKVEPPQHHAVISTPLGPIGLLICYDLFFPEAFRALVRAGARTIIIPTFTKSTDASDPVLSLNPSAEALFIRSALVTRAFENTCCVVFCNVGGPVEEGFVGLSGVAMPVLGMLGGWFEGEREGLRVVEVDLGVLGVAEGNYRIREDLGREGFHYL